MIFWTESQLNMIWIHRNYQIHYEEGKLTGLSKIESVNFGSSYCRCVKHSKASMAVLLNFYEKKLDNFKLLFSAHWWLHALSTIQSNKQLIGMNYKICSLILIKLIFEKFFDFPKTWQTTAEKSSHTSKILD